MTVTSALLIVAAAMLTAGVVLVLLRALARPAAATDAMGLERQLYRQRLADIASEHARGLVTAAEAEALRAEAARILIARQRTQGAAADTSVGARTGRSLRPVAAALALGVPALAVPLYLWLGAPGPEAEWQARSAAEARARAEREAPLAAAPQDPATLIAVARTHLAAGDGVGAVRLLGRALPQRPDDPQLLGALVEARITAGPGGPLDTETTQLLARGLALAPGDPRLRFYEGYRLAQQGDAPAAREIWRSLLADGGADAPWRGLVAASLQSLDRGGTGSGSGSGTAAALPAGADAMLALPQAEQAEAIAAMVDGLAARLQASPDDPDGWRRLAQARATQQRWPEAAAAWREAAERSGAAADWMAAGEAFSAAEDSAAALAAFRQASAIAPEDAGALALQAAILKDRPGARARAAALSALARARRAQPDHVLSLWLSGELAAKAGDRTQARALFDRALARLPADSAEHAALAGRADTLLAQ